MTLLLISGTRSIKIFVFGRGKSPFLVYPREVASGCPPTTQVCVNLLRDAVDDFHAFGVRYDTFAD
jgi:hypothetical protein